jgi:hypothetical protein
MMPIALTVSASDDSGAASVNIRADRTGGGNGRAYVITMTCSDTEK